MLSTTSTEAIMPPINSLKAIFLRYLRILSQSLFQGATVISESPERVNTGVSGITPPLFAVLENIDSL